MQISQSDVVRLRRARWRILDVRGYAGCQVLLVAGADPCNAGAERRFVLPFDEAERIERRLEPVRASRRRWRRVCRALLAGDAPPGGLACARDARIDLLPHQLEPALAIVRGLGSRVLLADEVGLGKDRPGRVDRRGTPAPRCGRSGAGSHPRGTARSVGARALRTFRPPRRRRRRAHTAAAIGGLTNGHEPLGVRFTGDRLHRLRQTSRHSLGRRRIPMGRRRGRRGPRRCH